MRSKLKSLLRRPSSVRCSSSVDGRRGVVCDPVRDPANERCDVDRSKLDGTKLDRTKLDGTKLDGPRPPRAAIDCLAAALRAEQQATSNVAAAREQVRDCLAASRREGATYSSVAAALVGPKGTIKDTLLARKRMANALACRVFEARKRSKT